MPFRLLFLILPLAEIAAFILIGGEIGVLATLALVLLTAICGLALLRITGVATLMKIKADVEARRLPARPLAEGAMMALGSVLLIVPGFVTDAIGLLLLIPPVRGALFRWFARHAVVVGRGETGARYERPQVIELEEGDYRADPRPDSPWRRNGRP